MKHNSFKTPQFITNASSQHKLEKVSFANEIANKINVLDSIMWVSDTVNQVSKSCVSKCFQEAGFKGPDDDDDDDDDDVNN